jgi:hypothetical protein
MKPSWSTYSFRRRVPSAYVDSRPWSVSSPSWLGEDLISSGLCKDNVSMCTRYRQPHHLLLQRSWVHRLRRNAPSVFSIVMSPIFVLRLAPWPRSVDAGQHCSTANMALSLPFSTVSIFLRCSSVQVLRSESGPRRALVHHVEGGPERAGARVVRGRAFSARSGHMEGEVEGSS